MLDIFTKRGVVVVAGLGWLIAGVWLAFDFFALMEASNGRLGGTAIFAGLAAITSFSLLISSFNFVIASNGPFLERDLQANRP